jgi:hypothetical protein
MKILGYEYKLVDDGDVDSMGAFGRFHSRSQKLQIAKDLCEQQIVSTTLHEVIEALNYHLEWKLEHSVIMGMEAALYQTLCENGVDLRPIASEVLRLPTPRALDQGDSVVNAALSTPEGYTGKAADTTPAPCK